MDKNFEVEVDEIFRGAICSEWQGETLWDTEDLKRRIGNTLRQVSEEAKAEEAEAWKTGNRSIRAAIEEAERKLADLERSILDLSHPNIKSVLTELEVTKQLAEQRGNSLEACSKQLAEAKKCETRILWDLCEEFNLGAGGCPDGLLRELINQRTRERDEAREALIEIRDTMEKDGRFENTVPEINKVLNGEGSDLIAKASRKGFLRGVEACHRISLQCETAFDVEVGIRKLAEEGKC